LIPGTQATAAAVPVRSDGGRGVAVPVAARQQRARVDESLGLVHPAERVVLGNSAVLVVHQRPGRAVEERDRRGVTGRRQAEQVVDQCAVGSVIAAGAGGRCGARHRRTVAAVADAVSYTTPAAARHGGYLGHARRQIGRRVDQQRVGTLSVAGATERGGRSGHGGQGRV